MNDAAIERRRGGARVQYSTDALITSPYQPRVVFARTADLSPSGVFVRSPEIYKVGTPLRCTIILHEQHVTLKGRVARVTEVQPSGMGIVFTDLRESVLSLLHEVLASEHLRIRPLPVKLPFRGISVERPAHPEREPGQQGPGERRSNYAAAEATLLVNALPGADRRIWNWAILLLVSGFLITLTTYLVL